MKVRTLNQETYMSPLYIGDMVHTPIVSRSVDVPVDWLDYNGHMNEAFYITAASLGFEAFVQYLGMDKDFVANVASYFTLENHNVYMRECRQGDTLTSCGRLLDCDARFVHLYYDVYRGDMENQDIVFSMEQIKVLVDVHTRRSTALDPHMFARIQAIHEAHKALGVPKNVGHVMHIRKR